MKSEPLRLLAAAVWLLGACSDGDAGQALEAAAPFRGEHARFAEWAERTLDSEAGHPRSRAELVETLFAPLLLDSGVVTARVARGDRVFLHGEPLAEGLHWQVVREGNTELRVAREGERVILATQRGRYEVTVAYAAGAPPE